MTRSRGGFAPYLIVLFAALVAVFAAVGCGGDDDDGAADKAPVATGTTTAAASATSAATPTVPPLEGGIVVFAASSLTESFKELGEAFSKANPKAKVTFNFAASSALATQINEAAAADVFASADLNQMKNVVDKGNANKSAVFAKNSPVVVVPKGSTTVATFNDLAKPGAKVVLAAPEVPIGRYSRDILKKASETGGISADFSDKALANLKSNEANVRAVLTKVQLGEADAGIVYRTDVAAAAGQVTVVEIPAAFNVVAEYPIATVKQSKNTAVAEAFVAFVRSSAGATILEKYGFGKP